MNRNRLVQFHLISCNYASLTNTLTFFHSSQTILQFLQITFVCAQTIQHMQHKPLTFLRCKQCGRAVVIFRLSKIMNFSLGKLTQCTAQVRTKSFRQTCFFSRLIQSMNVLVNQKIRSNRMWDSSAGGKHLHIRRCRYIICRTFCTLVCFHRDLQSQSGGWLRSES